MLAITTINVLAVLVFAFVAGFGWSMGAFVAGWIVKKRGS